MTDAEPLIIGKQLDPLGSAKSAPTSSRSTTSETSPIFPRVQSILEVAAGTGALTRALAATLPESARIVATDLNPAYGLLQGLNRRGGGSRSSQGGGGRAGRDEGGAPLPNLAARTPDPRTLQTDADRVALATILLHRLGDLVSGEYSAAQLEREGPALLQAMQRWAGVMLRVRVDFGVSPS